MCYELGRALLSCFMRTASPQRLSWKFGLSAFLRGGYFACQMRIIFFSFFPEAMNFCFPDPHSCLSPETGVNLPSGSQASPIYSSRFAPLLHIREETGDWSICLAAETPSEYLKQLIGMENAIAVCQTVQELFHYWLLRRQTKDHGTLLCTWGWEHIYKSLRAAAQTDQEVLS